MTVALGEGDAGARLHVVTDVQVCALSHAGNGARVDVYRLDRGQAVH